MEHIDVTPPPRPDCSTRLQLRSVLYNWPAKIEHWPADLETSENTAEF